MSPNKIACVLTLALACVAYAEGETLRVAGGLISGTSEDGIRTFKGIPYAAPPVGDLRWRPPQPVVPWDGIRRADTFGAECPQPLPPAPRNAGRQSEDCLFVNVWTAASRPSERRPVMVWIHGGGFTTGAGSNRAYHGAALAEKGVVLVTFNYRLGPLGFLAHPELSQESENGSSGNYGVLDQIAALKWVEQNVAAFGGDPSRVTIFGESAGSSSVSVLLASPLAAGLFHRAIGESGGSFGRIARLRGSGNGQTPAEEMGVAFAAAAAADSLEALRALSAQRLVEVFANRAQGRRFRMRPHVDGWVLPDEVRAIFAEGKQNDVPVIVGSNANEMTTLTNPATIPLTLEDYRNHVESRYGDMAEEFDAVYPVENVDDIIDAYLGSLRDSRFTLNMRTWARLTATGKSEAYLYYFSHVPPIPNSEYYGAYHAAEVVYAFDNLHLTGRKFDNAEFEFADVLSAYWVNFASSGNPNGEGLPEWIPYDQDAEPYMEFGDSIHLRHHLLKDQLDFIERFLRHNPG